jgi:signal transduction histidine kinase
MARVRSLPGDGSALIVVLLLASLALAAAVAWQAQDAARSHRVMAERVLRDYAGLAADEMVRRSSAEVGYRGYYVLIQALSDAAENDLPAPADLAEAGDERLRRAAALARFTFLYRPDDGGLTVGGRRSAPTDAAWLRARLAPPEVRQRTDDTPMRFLHEVVDGEATTAVFAPVSADAGAVAGFVVERAALASVFARVLAERTLLPPSLGAGSPGTLTNDDLSVWVVDLAGQTLYPPGISPESGAAAADPYASRLYAARPFGDAYGGNLEGATVRVAIDPAAAPKLVIGGLPRSRLPLLLALLGLTAGLVATAIFQLRRARKLTRLRSDFVSQVSHELRTPLTQIRMFAETLRLGRVRSEAEGRRSLEIVDREARRLGHLVENILQFSRGERGTLELTRTVQPLAPLLAEVVEELAPLLEARGARVRVRPGDGDPVEAAVDAGAFRQILLNLLDNAVKYGPEGQEILLETSRREGAGSWMLVTVDDQGPGVPRRDRERIWQSFRRLDRDRDRAVAGTGIGLAVVRELVERHGGRARVEDGWRGGARFIVELPCEPRT